jgi:predicted transcriptional regulator
VNLKQFVEQFNLYYCGDLLSDVMANAPIGCVWLTVQAHQNIVKVALLREMAAIVLTGGQAPDEETIERANQEGLPILMWPGSAYALAGQAHGAGVANLSS